MVDARDRERARRRRLNRAIHADDRVDMAMTISADGLTFVRGFAGQIPGASGGAKASIASTLSARSIGSPDQVTVASGSTAPFVLVACRCGRTAARDR